MIIISTEIVISDKKRGGYSVLASLLSFTTRVFMY